MLVTDLPLLSSCVPQHGGLNASAATEHQGVSSHVLLLQKPCTEQTVFNLGPIQLLPQSLPQES
jgi:hypothetical protein